MEKKDQRDTLKRLRAEEKLRREEERQQLVAERSQRVAERHRRIVERQRFVSERQDVALARWLLDRVLIAFRQAVRARQQACAKRWGVKELPPGLEAAKLHAAGDSLCAVLSLRDGLKKLGPPRQTLREAKLDLDEVVGVQREHGDSAACTELERRDVDAMTGYFLEQLK